MSKPASTEADLRMALRSAERALRYYGSPRSYYNDRDDPGKKARAALKRINRIPTDQGGER